MALLSDIPDRARFALTYEEVRSLPVRLRDKMMEQIQEWRSQEDSKRK